MTPIEAIRYHISKTDVHRCTPHLVVSPEASMPPEGPAVTRAPSVVSGDVGRRHFVGAKAGSGVWQRIISEMPPHDVYLEAFVGTGKVMKEKRPARSTIAIDEDPAAPGLAVCSGLSLVADAVEVLNALADEAGPSWLVYADPPYLASVRSCQRDYYRHEFRTPEQHISLLSVLKRLRCNVMLSGYESDLYAAHLADWRVVRIPTVKRNGERSTECLWLNFPEPFEFHDTRFLGKNFRERERIKRKKGRWVKRLAEMSRLDRAAVLDAIDALRSGSSRH